MSISETTNSIESDHLQTTSLETSFPNSTESSISSDLGLNETLKYARIWDSGYHIKIVMTCIYALIFLCGISVNFIFCIILIKVKELHTATNFYLLSMSCSDMFVLLFGLPFDFYSLWSATPYFDRNYSVFHSLLLETSTDASILTITVFTIERYIAICHPLLSQTMFQLGRVPKVIGGIWIVSIMITTPVIVYHPSLYDGEMTYDASAAFITLSFVLLFVIPMILIAFLYLRIIMELKRSQLITTTGESSAPKANFKSSKGQIARNRDVIKMLVAIVVSFFLCFSPLQSQRLLSVFGNQQKESVFIAGKIMIHVSGVFLYLSTCMNPILYHIMSDRFRKAMWATFPCLSPRRKAFHFSSTSRNQWTIKSRISSYQTSRTTRISEIPSTTEPSFASVETETEIKKEMESSSSTSLLKYIKNIRDGSPISPNNFHNSSNIVNEQSAEETKPQIYIKSCQRVFNLPGTSNICKHESKVGGERSESVMSEISVSNCSMFQMEDDE